MAKEKPKDIPAKKEVVIDCPKVLIRKIIAIEQAKEPLNQAVISHLEAALIHLGA